MKLALPASIASPEDVRETIDELRTHGRGRSAGIPLSPAAKDVLILAKCDADDRVGVDELVRELETIAHSAPRVSLTLAAPVDPRTKAVLTDWFRTHCSPTVLVTIGFNRAILGGALVRAGSRIHDWSFRSRLLEPSVSFGEVLERV